MIRPTHPQETGHLMAIARGTGVFKPIEIDALGEVLDDYHDGNLQLGHHAVTYEQDGRAIGFAYYAPTPMTDRTWHLFWIFVDQGIQARGIGSKLLKHAEEEIRQSGGRLLIIETSSLPTYKLTRKFYLKYGYTEDAVVHDFYGQGDDMVIFTKRL